MDFSTERKIVGGFASLIAILVLLGTYSYYNNEKSNEANASILHTNEVLLHLGQVRNAFFDYETSVSTFLIHQNEQAAQENLHARAIILQSLNTLYQLTAGSTLQQARLDSLKTLLRHKNAISNEVMNLDKQHLPMEPTQIKSLQEEGLLLTVQVKELITRFRLFEREQRERKKAEYESYLQHFRIIIICLFLLLFVSIVLIFIAFYSHLKLRHTTEQTIRQNWQTIQAILDNTSAFISIKDLDLKYTLVNKAFEVDPARPKGYYIGKTDATAFSEKIGQQTAITDRKVLQEGVPIQYTSSISQPDGDHHFFVVKFPLRNANNDIFAIGNISTEATEQVKLEEANRKAAESVYDLYHHAPCGYHAVDSHGTIVEMNDTQLKWLGYTREEVIGKMRFSDLLASELQEQYRLHVEKKAIHNVELRVYTKTGTQLHILLNTEPILDDQKNFLKSRTVVLDNTERKKQEDKIKQLNLEFEINNVLLQAANTELEAFTYSVSHDLRAPLRSIRGYAEILLEDNQHVLDQEGKNTVQVIIKNTRKMGKLIEDLLEFSRMGKQNLQKGIVDFHHLVQLVLSELPQHKAEVKILHLPAVKADSNMMKQVWINLISNAIKYSEPKTHPIIEIGCREELMEDIFFVRDNGVGFDMQFSHKLFTVFQRLHRQEEFDGTGVGLAFVDRIITKHGGKVWAESTLNEGSIFYFSLPRLESLIYS